MKYLKDSNYQQRISKFGEEFAEAFRIDLIVFTLKFCGT